MSRFRRSLVTHNIRMKLTDLNQLGQPGTAASCLTSDKMIAVKIIINGHKYLEESLKNVLILAEIELIGYRRCRNEIKCLRGATDEPTYSAAEVDTLLHMKFWTYRY